MNFWDLEKYLLRNHRFWFVVACPTIRAATGLEIRSKEARSGGLLARFHKQGSTVFNGNPIFDHNPASAGQAETTGHEGKSLKNPL